MEEIRRSPPLGCKKPCFYWDTLPQLVIAGFLNHQQQLSSHPRIHPGRIQAAAGHPSCHHCHRKPMHSSRCAVTRRVPSSRNHQKVHDTSTKMVYNNPHKTGQYNPLYPKQPCLFHCSFGFLRDKIKYLDLLV